MNAFFSVPFILGIAVSSIFAVSDTCKDGASFRQTAERSQFKLQKKCYEVIGSKGDRPGYANIQDAIEAARGEGASLHRPAIIVVEPGRYEENFTLYAGIEIEGMEGKPFAIDKIEKQVPKAFIVPPSGITLPAPACCCPPGAGTTFSEQILTGTGTYTPTPGTSYIYVQIVGGGGAGGGAENSGTSGISSGSGGGAGGYSAGWFTAAATAFSVGAGGIGVPGANGGNGAATTFGSLTANGGAGGIFTSVDSVQLQNGGAGGAATGQIASPGQNGGLTFVTNTLAQGYSGPGAPGPFSGGAPAATPNLITPQTLPGIAANGFGGGGSGGYVNAAVGIAAGGNGSAGTIIIIEFH